jgi:hypothetical protein
MPSAQQLQLEVTDDSLLRRQDTNQTSDLWMGDIHIGGIVRSTRWRTAHHGAFISLVIDLEVIPDDLQEAILEGSENGQPVRMKLQRMVPVESTRHHYRVLVSGLDLLPH